MHQCYRFNVNPAEFLRKSIYLIHEKIKLENFEPEELFEMENGVVSISKRAEHSYFIRHAKYLGKGEKALSIYMIFATL